MPKTLTAADLTQFHGGDTLYHTPFHRPVRYTEGARHVFQAGEAWWLLDVIVSYQRHPKVRGEGFQVWTLTVTDARGVVVCEDGNGRRLVTQDLPYTDFPLDEVTLWVDNHVVLLPSEY